MHEGNKNKKEPEMKTLGNFDSPEKAYTFIQDSFFELLSYLKSGRNLYDPKLEILFDIDEKGRIESYCFLGKVKFTPVTVIEADQVDITSEDFVVIQQYYLNLKNIVNKVNQKSKKDDKLKQCWVLEKIIE